MLESLLYDCWRKGYKLDKISNEVHSSGFVLTDDQILYEFKKMFLSRLH